MTGLIQPDQFRSDIPHIRMTCAERRRFEPEDPRHDPLHAFRFGTLVTLPC